MNEWMNDAFKKVTLHININTSTLDLKYDYYKSKFNYDPPSRPLGLIVCVRTSAVQFRVELSLQTLSHLSFSVQLHL